MVYAERKKVVTCLEDLQCFTVKESKKILEGYKEKTSGCKSGLMLRVYAIYCGLSRQIHSLTYPKIPQMVTNQQVFRRECILLSWTTNLREIPDLSFLQLYQYLLVRTEKYGQNYLKTTSYKKLKAFQFYYEWFIKT